MKPPVEAGAMLDGAALNPLLGRDGAIEWPSADVQLILPYLGDEQTVDLDVVAELKLLDVHFSMDTTASFFDEIDALQSALNDTVIAELEERIEDLAFGVSKFEDFPLEPFGIFSDRPYELLTALTTNFDRVRQEVNALDDPLGNGADIPESSAEALWQIATGAGYETDGIEYVAPAPVSADTEGGVGFRKGALRVVVHITDAPSHTPADYEAAFPGTHDLVQAAEALSAVRAHVLGIASASYVRPELEDLAIATEAWVEPVAGQCLTGIDGASNPPRDGKCPAVFDVEPNGQGLSEKIVDAIVSLVNAIEYGEVYGASANDGLGFVKTIEAVSATSGSGATVPERADLRPPGDGTLDTFLGVRPGDRLKLRVHARNTSIPSADYEQRFYVQIDILGDGLVLEHKTLEIIVPRSEPDAG